MNDKLVTIYKITNNDTGKIYIGQTTVGESRLLQHFKVAKECALGNKVDYNGLYTDINQLGEANFSFESIDTCFFRHRFIIEEFYIMKYKNEGFNIYNLNAGSKQNDEQKEKVRIKLHENKATYQTNEFKLKMSTVTSGDKNGMYGKAGELSVNGQTVFKKDKYGNILDTFPSVRCSLAHLGIKGHAQLIEACKTGNEYKGYYWSKTWSDR